jgi:hypothetical protein
MAVHRTLSEALSSLPDRASRATVIVASFGTSGSKGGFLVDNAGQQQPHSVGHRKAQAHEYGSRLLLHGLGYAGLYESIGSHVSRLFYE